MTEIINFCNNNQGFLSGILSFLTFLTSIIAIGVSINSARLPYKRKIMLALREVYFVPANRNTIAFNGYSVDVTNIGNMPLSLEYFGLAVKDNGQTKKVYTAEQNHSCTIAVGETKSINYNPDIKEQLQNKDYFLLAIDMNGKHYIKSKKQLMRACR